MQDVSIAQFDDAVHATTDQLIRALETIQESAEDDAVGAPRYTPDEFRPIFRSLISKYLAGRMAITREGEFRLKWESKNLSILGNLQQNVMILDLQGTVDNATVPTLDKAIGDTLAKEVKYMVIDHGGLKHISSAGLSVLFDYINKFRKTDGDIKLVNVPERIYKIYDLLGFTSIFKFFKTTEEAISKF